MPKSVLVDTNILIDSAVPGRPEHMAATMLEESIVYSGLKAYIAATSLKDTYFLIKSETDAAFAREYIQCLLKLYTIASVDLAVCSEAAFSNEPDFEDGIIRACAETLKVDYIISRDEKAFKRSHIKRLSAQEYADAYIDYEVVDILEPPV